MIKFILKKRRNNGTSTTHLQASGRKITQDYRPQKQEKMNTPSTPLFKLIKVKEEEAILSQEEQKMYRKLAKKHKTHKFY